MKKALMTFVAALFGSWLIATPTLAVEEAAKQKAVYHVNYDDPKQIDGALRNIQNHINAVGAENLDLRVVMHGKGLDLLILAKSDMNTQSKVIGLKDQHVKFEVCKNTLTSREINYETDLFDVTEADIVPSGVAELAKLQGQGYAYIKP